MAKESDIVELGIVEVVLQIRPERNDLAAQSDNHHKTLFTEAFIYEWTVDTVQCPFIYTGQWTPSLETTMIW